MLDKFGNMEFEELESEWFEMYPGTFKHGNCRKKDMIILSLNMSLNTKALIFMLILSRKYVFREDSSISD